MHLKAIIGWIRMQDWSLSRFPPSHATKEYYQRCTVQLIADNAPLYQSSAITKYLSDMHVSLWQCEAKYQHQNYMERHWQVVKRYTNQVLD